MDYYLQLLAWLAVVAMISGSGIFLRQEEVLGYVRQRYLPIWSFIIGLPLVFAASLRGNFSDTATYLQNFARIPSSFREFSDYLATITKDQGFTIFSWLLKRFVGENQVFYLAVIAAIQLGILIWVYRKYSEDLIFSLFLFFSSGDIISWVYNGMRQFLAAALIFSCTGFLLKRKYLPVILMILLASCFHQSALLMLPMLWFVQGPAWKKRNVMFICLILLAVFSVGEFTNLLDDSLSQTQYSNVVNDWQATADDGTSFLRVLVFSAPALLAFYKRRLIARVNNPLINLSINMSVICSALYLLSMVTSGIYIGRLPIYFSLYNYILLPWEIKYLFTKKSRGWLKLLVICLYLLFFYFTLRTIT